MYFKFLLDTLRKHKNEAISVILLTLFSSILVVVVPYIYGKLFDYALADSPYSLIFSLIFIWVLLTLLIDFTENFSRVKGEILAYKIATKIESDFYGHWISLPYSFHKEQRKGKILQKIARGIYGFERAFSTLISTSPQILILIFAIGFMLYIQWLLGLFILASILIYFFATLIYVKPAVKTEEKMHRIWEKIYGIVYDRLFNISLIKFFSKEKEEKKRIEAEIHRKTLNPFRQMIKKWNDLLLTQRIIYSLSFVVILSIAIIFLKKGMITPGEFVMFFGYTNLVFSPFFRIAEMYRAIKESSVGIKRMIKLKRLAPEFVLHGNKKLDKVKGEIKIKDVTFSYDKKNIVLKDINLIIKANEKIALVGKSGVGKTTLAQLIMGYYKPEKGSIFLDGKNIIDLDLEWLRNLIAFVPQEIALFNDTIKNNLKYANPKATMKEIIKACKLANADEFIVKLPKKYDTIVGERGVKLSVGQKQRIAIAMAILRNPKIVILDEPTSALDIKSEKMVKEGLRNLFKNRTVIIISHRLSLVRDVDKIAVIDKGKIVEIGNHKELMKKRGLYFNLYKEFMRSSKT